MMSIYSSQTEMGSTRWALFLQDFDFTVTYRPGPENSNADGLSRQCWTLEEEVETSSSRGSNGLRRGRCGDQPQTEQGGSPAS